MHVERGSRVQNRSALVVQDLFSNWIQNYLAKYKNSAKTLRCLQRFVPHTQTSERIDTGNSLDFIQAWQDLQWTHDTFAHIAQKTDNVVERAVRRVKEGTAAALVQSGLSEELLGQAMKCCGQLRNVYDKLAESETAYTKRYGLPFDGLFIPFAAKILFKPRRGKVSSILHQVASWTLHRLCLKHGTGWSGDLFIAESQNFEN